MEYTTLGSTGMEVSKICLGCMSFGSEEPWMLDREESHELIERAIDLGVNFFDTANAYSDGESEELLGDVLAEYDRDLGVFLYTREVNGAREYWFDEDGDSLPELEDWQFDQATMVWDNGVAYTTWWTDHPEPVHGINWLPIGGHSLYLGLNTSYADANYRTVEDAVDGSFSYWEDVMWKYRALSDPDDAIEQFDAAGEEYDPEFGTSRAHTYHWIATLGEIGSPDPTVTADTPLAAVFNGDDGRSYVAYNADGENRTVSFSDGTTIDLNSGELGVYQR